MGEATRLGLQTLGLLVSLEAARALASAPALPIPFVATSLSIWILLGWICRKNPAIIIFAVADIVGVGVFFWQVPWTVGLFAPIWVAIFCLASARVVVEVSARATNWASKHALGTFRYLVLSFPRGMEISRLAFVAGAGILSVSPFLHDGIIGGDDSRWYSSIVADTNQQWRMGIIPTFVGQTRYSPNGAVMPIRVAPYLQHLAGVFDFMTGRTLSPYLLLNFTIIFSCVGAGVGAYLSLLSLMPSKRCEAVFLALLYLWSPAVIGLAYNGQLFMSVMTLPFLPIVFAGVVRIYKGNDGLGWMMVAAGCAATWLAHSPIGFWTTASASILILARWPLVQRWDTRDLFHIIRAAFLFIMLCGYIYVSVATLKASPIVSVSKFELLGAVKSAFPASLMPLSRTGGLPRDIQLGWSLWSLLLAGCFFAWRSKSRPAIALTGAAFVLVCLALPVPVVNYALWHWMPQCVVEATNAVPMQRMYPLLAACAIILGGVILAGLPHTPKWAFAALAIAAVWSASQSNALRLRGFLISNSTKASEHSLDPENLSPTRFSFGMLGNQDRFYSDGFMDFAMEQRILGGNFQTYITSNVSSIVRGHDFGHKGDRTILPNEMVGSSPPGERVWVNLTPKLTLEPSKHYLLALDVLDHTLKGVLQVTGQGFYREYGLPSSGNRFAFGSDDENSHVIPLSTTSDVPIELTMTLNTDVTDLNRAQFSKFGRYALIPYEPKSLPIRLISLLPFIAEVRSPEAGWYEPFRLFSPGWAATVNGKPVAVRKSLNGLLAVPVAKGENQVNIFYKPSFLLLASYLICVLSWAALLIFTAWNLWSGRLSWVNPDEKISPI